MKKIAAGLSCLVFISFFAGAQSIYSFQGLGSLNHQGMPNNVGMGEVGIGTPTIWHINTQNPANLIYNTFSTFQVGLEVDRRRFSGNNLSATDTDGGLRFLGYAFPIIPGKWSSSFGILPYSSVGYNTFSENDIPGAPNSAFQRIDQRGEGGLTNFFWANGFKVYKNLSLGLKASYTFGSIEDTRRIQLFEKREVVVDTLGNTELRDFSIGIVSQLDLQKSYSDLNLQFGLSYRHEFSKTTFLNFGMTYTPTSELDETITLEDSVVNEFSDKRKFPTGLGFGVSYQKLNNYTIGFDFETQQWSDVARSSESFNNFSKIAFGATWIPDYDDVNSYLSRIKYSVGFNVVKLPYIVNNQGLTDFGINFGASLPVSRYSSLDLAFKWGQLGESGNGLIKENYYKIVIGATINDRWFIKRKYD